MEPWIVGFLKNYGAMATVIAAALGMGIPALVRLGSMSQRITSLEQNMNQRFVSLEQHMSQRFTSLEENTNQRFNAVEQRLDSLEADIRTEIRPAIFRLQEGLSRVERELAVQSERVNSFGARMAAGFSHLRDLIDERLPKRTE